MSNPIPQTVTVDSALKRGQWLIRYQNVCIVPGFVILSILITSVYNLSALVIPAISLAGVFFACFYSSNASVSWRIWAFANVRNVHELKARAIKMGLIDANPNFFTRLEIWTPAQKQKWEALQYKFNQPDLFTDDDTVPAETVVRFSQINGVIYIIIGLCILCIGGWLGFKHHNWVGIVFSIVAGVAGLAVGIVILNNRKPQIAISADGLTVQSQPFYNWGQIHNEDVIRASTGKTRPHYLVYDHGKTSEKINLIGLDMSPDRIGHVLRIYRGRSKKKYPLTSGNYKTSNL